ncbi:16S rRNA (guanine(1207)-N(2))-methyltransferase RsmC [Thaumasiovibrio subtropicus]|uniref:16S rRNA (guanine(1207)-N(2))-methyltransferase RsmC n=1 Tax=Thaumasiovibrio subtropicus TaxID=1891207 RepID=UPI000B36140D|nr:16S rRNA (guanine(1207)-N(2))-methyltransferase RsmC [Thaumasiovibrio subtropicus]
MSLSAPSQVVERQLAFLASRHVLIIGEFDGSLPAELSDTAASVRIFTTNYLNYLSLKQSYRCEFAAQISDDFLAGVDTVLMYWPKAKAEAEYLLAMTVGQLPADTELCVVGENRAGVKSAEKMSASYAKLIKHDGARRCSFYWGSCQHQPQPFDLNQWFKHYPLQLGDVTLTIHSLPGVFSHGEFDKGTRLLLENMPALSGKVLDFGCGAGIIGAWMKAKFNDIDVTMCDISALAIASAQQTLRQNGLEGNVIASNVYSDIDVNVDFLISNPPFHAGLKTSYSATETLLADAPKHLRQNGTLCIVANSFLQYPPIIEKQFGECKTLASRDGFKIYFAEKCA